MFLPANLVTGPILELYNHSEEYSIWISPSACSRSSRSRSVFSEVFIVEKVNGIGEKGSGDTTTVSAQTALEDFFNKSMRFACVTD